MRYFTDERNPYPISEEQLLQEYNAEPRECTFLQYINNCLSANSGTLTEIKE